MEDLEVTDTEFPGVTDESRRFWRGRPTLVTGATGLVGSWLTKRLNALQADVVCLMRDWVPQNELQQSGTLSSVRVVRGDVCDQGLLERILGEYEVDTAFHLAAQTIVPIANRNPVSTFETNIAGTWTLLEACRRSPCVQQIVIASSDKAYGSQGATEYDEDSPLQGRHPYDVSKSCADLIAQAYAQTYDLPIIISRCGNFFGGGDLNWNRIVPGTIRHLLRHERPVIRSDGLAIRDYFYVEDGAAAYTLLAERLAEDRSLSGKAFNFSNEQPCTVLELVRRITCLLGCTLEPDVRSDATNEIPEQRLSAARARSRLGWHPYFDLDTGLERTIRWYQEALGHD